MPLTHASPFNNYLWDLIEFGAEKRTRTSTVLPPPGPEPGASTNSAISARGRGNLIRIDSNVNIFSIENFFRAIHVNARST
jgi:hypothetical protein